MKCIISSNAPRAHTLRAQRPNRKIVNWVHVTGWSDGCSPNCITRAIEPSHLDVVYDYSRLPIERIWVLTKHVRLSASPKAIRCRHPLHPLIRCTFVDTKNTDQPSLDVLVTRFPPSSNVIRLRQHSLIRCTFVDTKNIDRPSIDVFVTAAHRCAFDYKLLTPIA
jgi:hypothetical protein